MARFLIGTMPMSGHVGPGLPIARELVKRGHEVWWYTGRKYQAKVEATGARFVPMKHARDLDGENLEKEFPELEGLTGVKHLKFALKYIFGDSAIEQMADYEEILKEFPADVLLSDTGFIGPALLHEKGGPIFAVFGNIALTLTSRDTAPFGLGLLPSSTPIGRLRNRFLHWLVKKVIFKEEQDYFNMLRAKVGLPATDKFIMDMPVSPYLYLEGTTTAFEYPMSDLPPQVHFVGPFLPDAPANFERPSWWHELDVARPVVHVTQGTVNTVSDDLIIPTIKALAEENVLVVVTTGGKPVETLNLESLPSNVRVESFIPHYHLLPYVDVMITNGGYNGVQIALANGVPLVAAGQTEEKPEVCNRIAWAGVGINLKTKSPTPEQIREAVKTILTDPQYREKAQAIKADYARYDAASLSADRLEQLVETREPVLSNAVAKPRTLANA